MTIIEAKTITAAFSEATNFLDPWVGNGEPYFWFRGINDRTLRLQPGACWRADYEELGPIVTFAQEVAPYRSILKTHSWETYCLAQHHGIPTRLLDWTESFAAALFFALDAWNGNTVPCIWITQPCLLNERFIGWSGVVSPENGEQYDIWLADRVAQSRHFVKKDDEGFSYDNDWPLALYPRKANARISAQQGTFTVHGRNKKPLDELFAQRGGDVAKAFARIDLVDCAKDIALKQLKTLGVRRSAIYPDIDNLVRQIREDYEW